MRKTFYVSPEMNVLELTMSAYIAASNIPSGKIEDVDTAEELPWAY